MCARSMHTTYTVKDIRQPNKRTKYKHDPNAVNSNSRYERRTKARIAARDRKIDNPQPKAAEEATAEQRTEPLNEP